MSSKIQKHEAFKHFKKLEGIAAVRTRLGLSQEAFAMQLGISRTLPSRAESKQHPNTWQLKFNTLEIQCSRDIPDVRQKSSR